MMFSDFSSELLHGGDLTYASAVFGEPDEPWQDLSTGISPWGYRAVNIPSDIWRDLPGSNRPLCEAAAEYYQTQPEFVVPLPGSQFAIGQVPRLLAPATVALPAIGYAEHAKAWQQAGHQAVFYGSIAQLHSLVEQGTVHHAVVINPNNPTAELCPLNTLEFLHSSLPGVVLVDEAFIDALALPSAAHLLPHCPRLCVLRSLGKFFGLAGIRLGFLLSSGELFGQMQQVLGPWAVSHPAQWMGERALNDKAWQLAHKLRLRDAQQQLQTILQGFARERYTIASGGLFVTLRGSWSTLMTLHQGLAEQGIYTRWCHWPEPVESRVAVANKAVSHPSLNTSKPAWLRIGLPEDGGIRIARALNSLED
ncbi:threonine-phosphate decarboxylase [uncultured Gilvimarinus sp.]|uniref:threonine-phosphate decarboxylase n=1 Tax=uncultured Gilvimarinus sp. TaxID=1689143 RepID=UPI0030EB3E39